MNSGSPGNKSVEKYSNAARERIFCRPYWACYTSALQPRESGVLRRRHVLSVEGDEFLFPSVAGILHQTHAAVPAQDRIIVARRTNFLSLAEAFQGASKQGQHAVGRVTGVKLDLGATFVQDSRVVEPFVTVGEFLEGFFRFAVTVGRGPDKLIGDREAE